jgi:long-chain acyl-CoA synthetase
MTRPAAKSVEIPVLDLSEAAFLKGLQVEFSSCAEMLVTRAREVPDRPFLHFYEKTYTYAQTNARANRVARFLKERGVVKGEVVSVLAPNAPEIFDVMFGVQKIGAVAHIMNFTLKGTEIAYLLDDARPRLLFAAQACLAELDAALALSGHRPERVVLPSHETPAEEASVNEVTLRWEDIHTRDCHEEALVPQSPDDPFLLLYSSGTTGHPKGILLSNRGQLSVCRDMARLGLVQGDDVMLLLLPLFHVNPICVWTLPMLFCGQTLCLRKAFSPADFWPAIVENRITILMGVPAMYTYVFHSIDPALVPTTLLKLRYAFSGAAPLSVDLIQGFKKRFGVEIIEGYGLTEGTGLAMANPPLGQRKAGTVGLPVREQEVVLLDGDGNRVPAGQPGEICLRGPAAMLGYLNNPSATAEALVDGWLHTGDVGLRDADGYITIVDRLKDMINRGGENIYPKEIETVLAAHPAVVEAAVIGVPDEALGERVKAVVEITAPGELTPEAIITYLGERLSATKVPEQVEIIDALPRNATGKVLKQILRDRERK